eukprot:CAMPEP_0114672804 /NCGR_PEP_ID=MMETSP0191-20121206/43545_1 /TAXON_ID=126664 /ORGANISM="Sorites sp." /LENGTH=115 /DNA_ID=CAMNT_0001936055 /DNA_START=1045 /DNA_END=1389 /DNA_ORIENTATION=-
MSNKLAKLEAQTTSYTSPEGNALPHGVTNEDTYSTEGANSTNEQIYNEQISAIENNMNTPGKDASPLANNGQDLGTYYANRDIIMKNDRIIAQQYQENQFDLQEATQGNDVKTPG